MPDFSDVVTAAPTGERLWLHKCKLVIANDNGSGYDLSNLRVKFRVQAHTIQTLKSAEITVLNLAPATLQNIFTKREFTQVTLSAGYQNGPFGNIFTGKIAYLRVGKEDALTSFLHIVATDCDDAYHWATINVTLGAGAASTPQNQLNAILTALKPYGVTAGSIPPLPATGLPRGKVMQGMVRDMLTDLARSVGCDWHFADGKLNFVTRDVPLTGDVIVLTPRTGLIGAPEQTLDGLNVRALLNPNIVTGRLIQISSSQVNRSAIGSGVQADYSQPYLPSLSANGRYMVYSLSHEGDTRGTGNDWVTEMIAVASDTTTPPLSATYLAAWIDGT
jgi:hypothetical protein